MVDQEELIKEIKLLSDSIRNKTRNLKMGIMDRDRYLETTFKPVVTPLQEISQKLKSPPEIMPIDTINEELNFESTRENDDEISATKEAEDAKSEEENDEDEVLNSTNRNESMINDIYDTSSSGNLGKKYFTNMVMQDASVKKKCHVYGARVANNSIMVGNSVLTTDHDDNIIIGGKTYRGTPGLYELIFKTSPKKFTSVDLKNFKNIMKLTNAHKKGYLNSSSVYRNGSKKYVNVIAKIFPPRKVKSGDGMSLKNLYQTNVIYYNDINKLVDRMKLLHEAKEAGHTGLDNEVVALTEELRSRGYIN